MNFFIFLKVSNTNWHNIVWMNLFSNTSTKCNWVLLYFSKCQLADFTSTHLNIRKITKQWVQANKVVSKFARNLRVDIYNLGVDIIVLL